MSKYATALLVLACFAAGALGAAVTSIALPRTPDESAIAAAIQKHEQETAGRAKLAQAEILTAARDETTAFAMGPKTATVTIVEFNDYNCGYCRRATPILQEVLKRRSDVRLIVRDFPVITPESREVALVALALREQDLAAAFYKKVSELQHPLNEAQALELAAAIGADMDRLKEQMSNPAHLDGIRTSLNLGARIGIEGTPTLLVNDEVVRGAMPLEQMLALIDRVAGARR